MVSIPKCLERLLPYLCVSSGEHEQHAKKHDMARNAARLGIMNLYCCSRSELISFYVEETMNISGALFRQSSEYSLDVMCTYMDDGPN